MTKVIDLTKEAKELKPIEFKQHIGFNCSVISTEIKPGSFKNIELICRKYNNTKHDLMFAYHDNRNLGGLYLGHFNDGIV